MEKALTFNTLVSIQGNSGKPSVGTLRSLWTDQMWDRLGELFNTDEELHNLAPLDDEGAIDYEQVDTTDDLLAYVPAHRVDDVIQHLFDDPHAKAFTDLKDVEIYQTQQRCAEAMKELNDAIGNLGFLVSRRVDVDGVSKSDMRKLLGLSNVFVVDSIMSQERVSDKELNLFN